MHNIFQQRVLTKTQSQYSCHFVFMSESTGLSVKFRLLVHRQEFNLIMIVWFQALDNFVLKYNMVVQEQTYI